MVVLSFDGVGWNKNMVVYVKENSINYVNL